MALRTMHLEHEPYALRRERGAAPYRGPVARISAGLAYEDETARAALKARGYQWVSAGRVWAREFRIAGDGACDACRAEIATLLAEGYRLHADTLSNAAKAVIAFELPVPLAAAIDMPDLPTGLATWDGTTITALTAQGEALRARTGSAYAPIAE